MMKKKLIFLGTGGSAGIPVIGCSCEVCRSPDPFNHRFRPSALLQLGERRFLIDAGPDFRAQALKYHIDHLDGVLLTHAHYDHTAGLDDLRPIYYKRGQPIPVLLSPETAQEVQLRYSYLFRSDEENFVSRFQLHMLPSSKGEVRFENVLIQYVSYVQGGMLVNGFRIGNLAYLSDIKFFSPSIFESLKGLRHLVISALRFTSSPLHLSVDEAVDFSEKIKPDRVWLTHVSHELEHHKTIAYLPDHINLAYDGLEIDFD